MTTYGAALLEARAVLGRAGIESAALDARLLLADAARLDIAALIARSADPLPALAEATFGRHLKRRSEGEPVARILGVKEFWGLPFEVTAATLVPRPDTETLVAAVLGEAKRDSGRYATICDLGAGAGAILIALLRELPEAVGVAVDISEAALVTARRNAKNLGVADRIRFHCGDFSREFGGPFDVVVSNPPYVPSAAIAMLERDVRDFDPRLALDGGVDGQDAYRAILSRAPALLKGGGLLAFEVGHDQSVAVADLCRANMLNEVRIRSDLAGIGRVVLARAAQAPDVPMS